MIRKEILLPATRDEVWSALTDPEELERWFANDVELDLRPGGGASFRWGNGECAARDRPRGRARRAARVRVGRARARSSSRSTDDDEGTRLTVVETSPAWSTALGLQALALACV